MDSKIDLIIQLAGVSLITLLTLFLRRSINVVALKHWTYAWLALSFALFCLRLAFGYDEYSIQLFSLYFFTEYLFGFLLIAGCRSLAGNHEMRTGQELFILPFIIVAFGLPFLGDDFSFIVNAHRLIMSGFFAIAFLTLWRSKLHSFGWKVMILALALLVVHCLQYFALFAARQYLTIHTDYLAYNSVIDLVLQLLLGFGMVIVLLEQVLSEARAANAKLKKNNEKLEELVHVDPLTTALNRHAFHGFLKQRGDENRPATGCVGFFDIDNLKTVNDIYGHAVGDIVIRAVVRAIRDIIRAEDLIFRWGGDEFFVIMVGLDSEMAYSRMKRMEKMLANVRIDGVNPTLAVGVSHAFANFDDVGELEAAIERADAGMYRNKQARKALIDENQASMRDMVNTLDVLVEST